MPRHIFQFARCEYINSEFAHWTKNRICPILPGASMLQIQYEIRKALQPVQRRRWLNLQKKRANSAITAFALQTTTKTSLSRAGFELASSDF